MTQEQVQRAMDEALMDGYLNDYTERKVIDHLQQDLDIAERGAE
jgi:hypothetical protein